MSLLSELKRQKALFASCPNCSEEFPVTRANLFDATDKHLPIYVQEYLGRRAQELIEGKQVLRKRRELIERSRIAAQAV